MKKGDDSFFRAWLIEAHGGETVENLTPSLMELVDWLVSGSALHQWRGYLAPSDLWEDEELVRSLRMRIRERDKNLYR